MSKYVNILITMLCINIMLVLGGVIPFGDSMVSSFFTAPGNDLANGITINSTFEGVVRDIPEQSGGALTELGFVDGFKLILGLFSFVIGTITAPFQLMFNPNIELPIVFRILVGLPLTIAYVFGIIGLLRGNE